MNTASPRPMPFAISGSSNASVPLAQVMAWRAPQNAARSASTACTSGPRMNWQCAEHARDRVVDRAAEAPALGGDVDERDWTVVHAGLADS